MTPHVFQPDPGLPPDYRGRRVCAVCHLLGGPGDAHHAMPVVPEQEESRRRAGDTEDEPTDAKSKTGS